MNAIAARCRLLACYHHGTDLHERLAAAVATQAEQRAALEEAATEIERLQAELDRVTVLSQGGQQCTGQMST